jgi:RNA polymerase sigma-70 factor (ECF subfamily)
VNGIESEKEFARLYDMVFPLLMRVAYRITGTEDSAEDICQDALFRLYETRSSFPTSDDAKFWLIRVVKNAALNYAKRKTRERKAYQKAFHERREHEDSSDSSVIKAETRAEVKAALDKLPLNLRIALILKEYADLNYKEIGRVLGISEGNVKVRIFRARERLSNLLVKEGFHVP